MEVAYSPPPKISSSSTGEKLAGMLLGLTLVGFLILASAAVPTDAQVKEGCLERCGDVSIPFPFGTDEHCFLTPYFKVTCHSSFNPPKLSLGEISPIGEDVPVLNISLNGELRILNEISRDCYHSSGHADLLHSSASILRPGRFNISSTRNKFTMVGCDTIASFEVEKGGKLFENGCMSMCDNFRDIQNGTCSGTCCCQTSIPDEFSAIKLSLASFNNYSDVWEFNPCGYAFVVEESHFTFSTNHLNDLKSIEKLPMVLDWALSEETCQVEQNNQTIYACKGNSTCIKRRKGWGYLCNCLEGYQGNPYLEPGCQDINECENSILNMCKYPKRCVNTQGGHTCSCPMWYHGEGRKDGEGCILNRLQIIHAAMGVGITLVAWLLGSVGLHRALKERRLRQLKKKHFRQNRGSQLQQQLSRQEATERIKFFTLEELERATQNYSKSNIFDRGGFGTVYRGTLMDGRVIAVKKPNMEESSQAFDFINEVGILSRRNHRHVLRLLGCCLETRVPLLVYEFSTNGTLSDFIHDKNKASALGWGTRLRIATQTAEALCYLHSESSSQIIDRDVKSTNILLDEDFNAKVCDFGAWSLVPSDQTLFCTIAEGIDGHLDPDDHSMKTRQVSKKSEVHSFGMVLVELLTGKKAALFARPKERKLLAEFLIFALKEDNLFEVVDDCIVNNENHIQILKVAELARGCLIMKDENRPMMKEVALELKLITRKGGNVEYNPEDTAHLLEESAAQCYISGGCETSNSPNSMLGRFLSPITDARYWVCV